MHATAENCTLSWVIDTVRKIAGPEATTRLAREPPSEKPVSHHIGDSEMRKSGSYGFQSSVKVVTWQFGKMTQPLSLEVQESLKLLRMPSDTSAFEERLCFFCEAVPQFPQEIPILQDA